MKKLLSVLLVVFAIIACKSPADPNTEPEFEPYVVGSFEVVSPTEAEYIGTQSQPKSMLAVGDTISIKQPGQQSLRLWRDSTALQSQFTMQFTDSTFTVEDAREYDVQTTAVFDNPKGDVGYPIGTNGWTIRFTSKYMESTFNMNYNCGSNFASDKPIIFIKYLKEDDSIYRVYAIHVNGMYDVLVDLVCN